MDVIVSPADQECSVMENGRVDKNKSQKSMTESHIKDRINTGQGTTANADRNTRISSSFVDGNRKRSFSTNTPYPNMKNTGQMKKKPYPNIKNTGQKKKKRKVRMKPTIGEILDPLYLKKKLASSNIWNIGENTHDTKIANVKMGLRTTATCEAKIVTLEKEKFALTNPETIATCDAKSILSLSDVSRTTTIEAEGSNTRKEIGDKEMGKITPAVTSRKLLLILDVNGLLADILRGSPPKNCIADKRMHRRAIFKRPFMDDFLRFCFERFHIAIWSSRRMQTLKPMVNYLLGSWRPNLLFLWDQSHCTVTRSKCPEAKHKCIVFKDLRKVWDHKNNYGSWGKGGFNESNTLLLDDSPYKALLNPEHTSVFPATYTYTNRNSDDSLGPKGDLRMYLEGLAAAEDMRTYVAQHPFGSPAVDETSPHWALYSEILRGIK